MSSGSLAVIRELAPGNARLVRASQAFRRVIDASQVALSRQSDESHRIPPRFVSACAAALGLAACE